MNRIQSRETRDINLPFQECSERTKGVDSSTVASGLPISRSQSDIARMLDPPLGHLDEDEILGRANKTVNGTPMKMLIAQEMIKEIDKKEVDSMYSPPNVVARLMGIEAIPQQCTDSSVLRGYSRGRSQRSLSHSGIPSESWLEPDAFCDRGLHEIHPCPEQNYKDVYAVWKKSGKLHHGREKFSEKVRHNDYTDEKKMAVVRQIFMDSKLSSTDEKLRQSKEFQDALEVLSSNKDSFLKFLQEPNSVFSQHLSELQPIHPPPETTRITVLRPCKMVGNEKLTDKRSNKQIKKSPQLFTSVWDIDKSRLSPSFANQKHDDHLAPPTRIVVLKPTTVKTHDTKLPVSRPFPSPRMEDFGDEPQNGTQCARNMAKEITLKMRENLMGEQRDEALPYSASSNGYVGDESSLNKSDNEYAAGSLSDSEVMSPICRHSWDYITSIQSPYSSSFSRASCSPDSSVGREAKKRLSERWAMVASSRNAHDNHVWKRSSTLGEMLALSDRMKLVRSQEDSGAVGDAQDSTSSITININKESTTSSFPENLSRSKSAPLSSMMSDDRFSFEGLDHETSKINASKELTKSKSMKLSLKGKVSSMFFSRKKSSKEKSDVACKSEGQRGRDKVESPLCFSRIISNASGQSEYEVSLKGRKANEQHMSSGKTPSELIGNRHDCDEVLLESLCVAQPVVSGNLSWNQDQPSPISVLEPPFEEDNKILESSGSIKQELGYQLLSQPLKSNLIDKSPPIGTIARTLSWDGFCAEAVTSCPIEAFGSSGLEELEDWVFLVRRLLSVAGLDSETETDSVFSRWHSLDSPLDPSLRDINANMNAQEPLYDVKQRWSRSKWKLVFDSVNDVLVEMTDYKPCAWACDRVLQRGSTMLVDRVCAQMKDLFCSEVTCVPEDGGYSNGLVVENMVRKEVADGGWADHFRSEKDIYVKDIEQKLLEELVEEAVVDLTGRLR